MQDDMEDYDNIMSDNNYIHHFSDIIADTGDIPNTVAEAAWEAVQKMKCKEFSRMLSRNGVLDYVYRFSDGETEQDLLETFSDEKVKHAHTIA